MAETNVKQIVIRKVGDFTEPQQKISIDEFIKKVNEVKGAEIVTIYSKTDPKPLKKSRINKDISNPYPNMRKVSKVNGLFNVDYENCVNNQLEREAKADDFKAKQPTWKRKGYKGSKAILCKIDINGKIELNDNGSPKLYFQFNPRNHYYSVYVDQKDKEITEDLTDFLKKPSTSSRQGTSTEIIWRTYMLSSIMAIKMNKVLYVIEN